MQFKNFAYARKTDVGVELLFDSVNTSCIILLFVLNRQSRHMGWILQPPRCQKFSFTCSFLFVGFPHREPLNLIKNPGL